MRTYVRAARIEWVWRMLLQGRDHLAAVLAKGDQSLIDSWEAEPGSTGSAGWDALLAAVVAHEVDAAGATAPAWSHRAPLADPWFPEHPFLSPDRVRVLTPHWLSRQNIYVPARDLVTA